MYKRETEMVRSIISDVGGIDWTQSLNGVSRVRGGFGRKN